MPSFNLSESLDALTYDFRPFIEASGTIPEPSADGVTKFQETLASTVPIKDGKLDRDALAAKIEALPEGSHLEDALYQSVADLCSGTPSVEQIRALPFRGQRAFIGWIVGTFLADPTGAATNA